MEYTKADLIIWPDDPRAKNAIGKKCYFSNSPVLALKDANEGRLHAEGVLINVSMEAGFPFDRKGEGGYAFAILKKETEKKYVPYDLSNKEDRDELRGKWIVKNNDINSETMVNYFGKDPKFGHHAIHYSAEKLLKDFVFLDTGLPVGKPVEEVEE